MARYYAEKLNGKVTMVVVQTEEGVFESVERNTGVQVYEDMDFDIPAENGYKTVRTTSPEFFEFMRKVERSDFMDSAPTEIQEKTGGLLAIINHVWDSGGV